MPAHSPRSQPLLALALLLPLSACNCGEDLSVLPGTISGRACDPDSGRGLGGAQIVLSGGKSKDRSTLADTNGEYTLANVAPGTYTVTATLGDVARVFKNIRLESRGRPFTDDAACRGAPSDPNGGALEGQICNRHTGELITGGQVTVLLASGDIMLASTNPNDGTFRISGIPEGDHVVTIQGDGFLRSFQITIVEKETTTLDLADGCEGVNAADGSLVGSFCNPADQGNLVGANVVVHRQESDESEDVTELTDTDGAFFVGGLVPGLYDVHVTHPDHDFDQLGVLVEAGAVAQVTDTANCADRPVLGRIEGQICDAAAGGLYIGPVDLIPGADTNGQEPQTVTSDSEGRFQFNQLNVGTYTVSAHNDAGYLRTYSNIVVSAYQTSVVTDVDQIGACPNPEEEGECVEFESAPTQVSDGRILLIVDRSGSMGQDFTGGGANDKWTAAVNALTTVTTALNANVEFGLMMFPDATSTQVPGACNENGNLELAVGPDNAGDVAAQLDNSNPAGGTPTAEVLDAARGVLEPLAQIDRPLAALLVTDGAPNCNGAFNNSQTCRCTNTSDFQQQGFCSGHNCIDDVRTIERLGAIRDLGVTTYVLGISGILGFEDVLDQMAVVGGAPLANSPKFYEANDEVALQAALDAITQQVVACTASIGDPAVDLNTMSVTVTLGAEVLTRDPVQQNGWDITGARTVTLFGAACAAAAASPENFHVRACP